MSGNGLPNHQGGATPGRATDPRLPHGGAGDEDTKEIGEKIRDGLTVEQAAARQALGAEQDEGYGAAETPARESGGEEAGLRARVAGAAGAMRERASEGVRQVRERAADSYDEARGWASERYEMERRRAADIAERGYGRVREGRRATEDFVQENPLLVGVVGLAAGLLLGALLPRTRQEDRMIGPWADEAREQGIRYARDMTQRGREFVVSALDPEHLDALDEASRHRREGGLRRDSDFRPDERPAHRL